LREGENGAFLFSKKRKKERKIRTKVMSSSLFATKLPPKSMKSMDHRVLASTLLT
jgi:hypothetical protein